MTLDEGYIKYESHWTPGPATHVTAAQELDRWVDYFMDLVDAAKTLKSRGTPQAEIERQIPPPEDMHDWWRFLQWKHADSVKKVKKEEDDRDSGDSGSGRGSRVPAGNARHSRCAPCLTTSTLSHSVLMDWAESLHRAGSRQPEAYPLRSVEDCRGFARSGTSVQGTVPNATKSK